MNYWEIISETTERFVVLKAIKMDTAMRRAIKSFKHGFERIEKNKVYYFSIRKVEKIEYEQFTQE